MPAVTLDFLKEQLELGEQLLRAKGTMFTPQDLPGRYGRVVKAIDHLLEDLKCEAVVAGGWAVWHHGYFDRMTQDIDIALAKDQVDPFLQAAGVFRFRSSASAAGALAQAQPHSDRRPDRPPSLRCAAWNRSKTCARDDSQPKGHGSGRISAALIHLPALVELKLAVGRARDKSDIIELLRINPASAKPIREHLAGVHKQYVAEFDRLFTRAREQEDQ